ncbi:hypothetical protein BSNK01_03910 [Bacillaceae bacterium]
MQSPRVRIHGKPATAGSEADVRREQPSRQPLPRRAPEGERKPGQDKPYGPSVNPGRQAAAATEERFVHLRRVREKMTSSEGEKAERIERINEEQEMRERLADIGRQRRFPWYRRPWAQILLPALGAVALGILFGLLVLTTFAGEGRENDAALSPAGKPASDAPPAAGAPESAIPERGANAAAPKASFVPPAQTYYVVQAGAFSDRERAEDVRDEYLRKGWAGIIVSQKPYYLFSGVAKEREQAMLLVRFYEKQGIPVYLKEWVIAGNDPLAVPLQEGDGGPSSFFAQAERLFGLFTSFSAAGIAGNHMQEEQGSGGGQAVRWQEMQELHRAALEAGRRLFTGLAEGERQAGEAMLNGLTKAFTAAEHYRKQPSQAYLWQVQQAMLEYVQSYQALGRR